jgi:FolB domain-containing protein
MSDRILVRGLTAQTRIGVTDEERAQTRAVRADIEVRIDLRRAGESDDLAHTLDYSAVIAEVAQLLEGGEFRLLEHAADSLASAVLANKGVSEVTVELAKKPPIPQEVDSVAVRITRTS